MAMNTYKTYLMHKATSSASYTKLIDITDYPDLGSEPEQIDVTTLSDPIRVYTPGIQDTGSLSFGVNYDHSTYTTLKALEGTEHDYAVWMGATTEGAVDTPTGSDGKFEFKGKLSVFVSGGGVNEARKMSVSISPTSRIVDATT